MKKMILKREGNDAYDSDEEKNPYATSVWLKLLLCLSKRLTPLRRRMKKTKKLFHHRLRHL